MNAIKKFKKMSLNHKQVLCIYDFPSIFSYSNWVLTLRLACRTWNALFYDYAPRNTYCYWVHNREFYLVQTKNKRGYKRLLRKKWFGLRIYGKVPPRSLEFIHTLDLSRFTQFIDVSALGTVHTLNLSYCDKVTDVSALGSVHTLDLSFCTGITDVSALGGVHTLYLEGCTGGGRLCTRGFCVWQIRMDFLEMTTEYTEWIVHEMRRYGIDAAVDTEWKGSRFIISCTPENAIEKARWLSNSVGFDGGTPLYVWYCTRSSTVRLSLDEDDVRALLDWRGFTGT